MSEIRIYVACLAAYNGGVLHGRWIDATQGESGIWDDVQAMLKASPEEDAEEWAIHDYEGFEGIQISEHEGFDTVAEYAAFIEERGVLGSLLIDHCGGVEAAKTALEDHYSGEYESISDFAEQLTEETTSVPDSLAFYIDYEKMGRDLERCDVFTLETAFREVHVFWNH